MPRPRLSIQAEHFQYLQVLLQLLLKHGEQVEAAQTGMGLPEEVEEELIQEV